MAPDIAHGERAIDRVAQRMEADIGVGMALKPAIMRHGHAAQHHVIARPEAVHVIAMTQPDIHLSPPGCVRPARNPLRG